MKQGMLKSDQVPTLIVGKIYLVPHITQVHKDNNRSFTIPIIPILHDDKDFNFIHKHYHVDGRFGMPIAEARQFQIKDGFSLFVVSEHLGWQLSEIFYLKKKCLRIKSGVPGITWQKIWIDWEQKMIGKSCKGRICPHKGALMQEVEGKLICPMHGLQGCIKNEKIIKAT